MNPKALAAFLVTDGPPVFGKDQRNQMLQKRMVTMRALWVQCLAESIQRHVESGHRLFEQNLPIQRFG